MRTPPAFLKGEGGVEHVKRRNWHITFSFSLTECEERGEAQAVGNRQGGERKDTSVLWPSARDESTSCLLFRGLLCVVRERNGKRRRVSLGQTGAMWSRRNQLQSPVEPRWALHNVQQVHGERFMVFPRTYLSLPNSPG